MTSCCFVEYRRDWSDNTNRKKNSKYLRDFKKSPPPNKQWGWMGSSGWEEEKVEEKQASLLQNTPHGRKCETRF